MKLSREEFDGYVEEAIAGLDAEFRRYLEEVPVIVEEEPDEVVQGQMGGGIKRSLLGLFRGYPLSRRSVTGGGGPNQIFLYRRNILRVCGGREELAERIRRTIVHELGHYIGFTEGQLRERGY